MSQSSTTHDINPDHGREIKALRAEVDDLRADLDAHRRTTALLIEDQNRKLAEVERQTRARRDYAEYYRGFVA